MSGSTYGNIFKITTWGESHGVGIGVVVDGCPAGLELNEEDIAIVQDSMTENNFNFADILKKITSKDK